MQKGLISFLFARGLGLLADEMFIFAVPIALYASTQDVRWSGLSLVGLTLSRALFMPVIASLADKFQLRGQYITVDLARIVIALLFLLLPSQPWLMLGLAGILTLLNGHAFVILEKTVVGLSVDSDRGSLQARLQTIEQLARVLGPACAGFMLQFSNLRGVAVASIAAFAISCSIILLMFHPAQGPIKRGSKPHHDIWTALRLIWNKPQLIWLIGVSMASNFVEGIILALAPMMFLTRYGRSEGDLGVFFSVTAATSIAVLTWLSMHKNLRLSNKVGSLILASMALIALVMPAANQFLLFGAFYMAFIVLRTVFVIFMRTERARVVDASDFGKVLGVMIAMFSLPLPLSGFLVSVLAPLIGPTSLQVAATALAIVFCLGLTWFVLRRTKKLQRDSLGNALNPSVARWSLPRSASAAGCSNSVPASGFKQTPMLGERHQANLGNGDPNPLFAKS